MRLTAFYQQAVTTVEEVIRSLDVRLKAAGLHCKVTQGEAAHTREGHPELSVEIWSDQNLVDVIEFTPDISYPEGGDTKELGKWFEREVNQLIAANDARGGPAHGPDLDLRS
jgi:hypothetical protein